MLTKGQITGLNDNTCWVRIPYFETAVSNAPTIIEAQIAIQPGQFNCYSKGDIVWLGFEHNKADLPVVIGKVYADAKTEGINFPGIVQTATLRVADKVELPADTKLGGTSLEELLKKVDLLDSNLTLLKNIVNPNVED